MIEEVKSHNVSKLMGTPITNEAHIKLLTALKSKKLSQPFKLKQKRLMLISPGNKSSAFACTISPLFTSKNLPAGVYEVRYKNLYENNITDRGSKSEQFSLSEMPQADGYSYSRLSLTLYKVKNGNTHTYDIPADQV